MAITRQSLLARRNELQLALDQAKAQAVALQGAIADTDYWLSKVDEPTAADAAEQEVAHA